jgi:hypothetical protein
MLQGTCAKARRVHLVLDNLNVHFRKSFQDALGVRGAARLLHRVRFRYTPEHASWLNMTEIEIDILTRQCLDRRLPGRTPLGDEVAAWHCSRNAHKKPSSRTLLGKIPIASWSGITFRNLPVEVLVRWTAPMQDV